MKSQMNSAGQPNLDIDTQQWEKSKILRFKTAEKLFSTSCDSIIFRIRPIFAPKP